MKKKKTIYDTAPWEQATIQERRELLCDGDLWKTNRYFVLLRNDITIEMMLDSYELVP
jgi:hypothetical protein